ncbi:antirepressor protein [Candidatus Omnitrophus magneticus]|uniref:Antirepressor protein n=1 Tax=Candidatus Omnitrophus magneticus TaxID=1609969 RepID=A0A0F0CT95_9BACT|nr:antirepressor protein [Candidatus Omnitrophus magneticus]
MSFGQRKCEQAMTTSIKTHWVQFYEEAILVIEYGGKLYVDVRLIIEGLHLNWNHQTSLIEKNETLGAMRFTLPTNYKGIKLCLPKDKLQEWLSGISKEHIAAKNVQSKIERYSTLNYHTTKSILARKRGGYEGV